MPNSCTVRLSVVVLTMAVSPACHHSGPVSSGELPEAATIYVNARVLTLDPERPRATGLRVEGERITHIFDGEPAAGLSGTRVDLGGATVLPGFVDAHLHLSGMGAAARVVDLVGTRSVAEVVARLHAAEPVGGWILGRGWDQNDWPERSFPTASDLDALGDVPVLLARIDGHAIWVNRAALAFAGIDTRTPDPEGGEILRHADGRPSGILVDNAEELVRAHLPQLSPAEQRADLLRAIALCNAAGLSGVHDMGVTPTTLGILEAMATDGSLTLRVTAYLHGTAAELAPILARSPRRDGLLRVVGVKLYSDGALGSRGAALLAPYSDRPQTAGLLVTPPVELEARVRQVHNRGYQAAIHAIGDRGVRVTLDAIALAQGRDRSRRHRVEHAQVIAPADIERFSDLGVVASVQPTHATSDMPWAEARLGPERMAGAYAWRTLQRAGAVVALGSDAPVESHDPWLGVYAAITRQDGAGHPPGGWRPEQRLTITEAISGFTRGPATVAGDDDLGVIRPGALADLTVVAGDPFAMAALELRQMRTKRTIVGGRQVFP